MSLLQYTSKEMFSSTELVRKSKNIFDKLNRKEIEKAIILRDGKPNTILLDFEEYEKIMTDYLKLKDKGIVEIPSIESEKNETVKSDKNISKKENIEDKKISSNTKIEDEDFQAALNKIDDLEFFTDNNELKKDKDETLKEFWDKD
jgi:PHD/YefM family antitoxin component YafN of YafNO toxin-antitoxin module